MRAQQCLGLTVQSLFRTIIRKNGEHALENRRYASRATAAIPNPGIGCRLLRASCQEAQISIACPRDFTIGSPLPALLPASDTASTPGQNTLIRFACGSKS